MNLPTREQCFELLKKYKYTLPEQGGTKHFLIVNKIAVFLAKKLKEKGEDIDVELVDRASLLNDMDKGCVDKDFDHGEMAHKFLIKEGYSEVAEVVRNHTIMRLFSVKYFTLEAKIVNYADCRVRHNDIVSVEERFADLKKRYSHLDPSNLDKAKPIMDAIEKEIFDKIGGKPEDINVLNEE